MSGSIPVRVTLLNDSARMPVAANPGDAGVDLHASEDALIAPGATCMIGTGLGFEIPEGTVAMVCSRSGLAAKHSVAVLNAPGVVDSGYRGEVKVILHNFGGSSFEIHLGDRVAQVIFQTYLTPVFQTVDALNGSTRGTGGFGSSGQ